MSSAKDILQKYTNELLNEQKASISEIFSSSTSTTPAPIHSSTTVGTGLMPVTEETTRQLTESLDKIGTILKDKVSESAGEILQTVKDTINVQTSEISEDYTADTGEAKTPIVKILGSENVVIYISCLSLVVGVILVITIIIVLQNGQKSGASICNLGRFVDCLLAPFIWLYGSWDRWQLPKAKSQVQEDIVPPVVGPSPAATVGVSDDVRQKRLQRSYLAAVEQRLRALEVEERALEIEERRVAEWQAQLERRSVLALDAVVPGNSGMREEPHRYITMDNVGQVSGSVNQVS